ncbi:MAG: ATP-dependent DNA helicase, partial [Kiritimatiellia bacterium]
GVGKTMAYLAPLLSLASEGSRPVAVSTHTINLQEQIARRDIPFLKQCLGTSQRAVVCKGRNNYLCLRRLFMARQMGGDMFQADQADWLEKVTRTAESMELTRPTDDGTSDGSLSAFADGTREPLSLELWSQVCAEYDNCLNRKCSYFRRCFLMRARSAAFEADLLILNHHLLFSNLALEGAPEGNLEGGFLPGFDALVIDEAHCMEQTAGDHFGLRLTQGALEMWLRRLYHPDTGRGLLAVLHDRAGSEMLRQAWSASESFFRQLHDWSAFAGRETRRLVAHPLDLAGLLPVRLREISDCLAQRVELTEDQDLQAELTSLARRGLAMRDSIMAFARQELENQVYWIETTGMRRRLALCSAPVEVGAILKNVLFDKFESVVLTSATLSVGGDLSYFKARVGAEDVSELVVSSPFDYSRQMRLYLVADLPDPGKAEFVDGLEQSLRFFLRKTAGRAFVLFTSAEMMRETAARLAGFLSELELPLLVQGRDLSRHAMLQRFRESGRAVLFGLDSFWMGVDVRGDALGNVIITRLPFAVPDEPVTKARAELIRMRGGNAFFDYALPEAVLKFRQGVGRLIRSTADEGIVVVLDPRIMRRSYGRVFLQSIPECPVEVLRMADL